MFRTASFVLAAVAIMSLSRAAFAADAAAGKELALRWCAVCHLVAPEQERAPTVAPPFATIANRPGFNADQLTQLMLAPHPRMPGRELSRDQAADIAAYIATLAK
jgi:mono/diheme cytochrome c family protein